MIVQATAFRLPFPDDTFDIIVADPPYQMARHKTGRGKRGYPTTSYVGFKGREWASEAWRVLKPSGRLYVVCIFRELRTWLNFKGLPAPEDLISWSAPNGVSINFWNKRGALRSRCWRPIIEWVKPPKRDLLAVDGLSVPNHVSASLVGYPSKEALPWPNQLPLNLLRYLLAPVPGDLVLDLFAGTGSTRIACEQLGKQAVSVDVSPDAIAINRSRAEAHAVHSPLTLGI